MKRSVRAADPSDDKPFVRTLTVRYFAGCYDETDVPEGPEPGQGH